MKKTLAILSSLTVAAAFAGNVDPGNEFGFVPVTGKTGLKAVSVPLAGYSVGDPTRIKISEILQTGGLAADDKLYTLGSDGKYSEYTLQGDGTWKASRVVTVDVNGNMVAASGTPATEATLARGQAFWLDTQATQVCLMGQATTDQPEVTLSTGWNLVGSSSMTRATRICDIAGKAGDFLNVNGKTYQYSQTKGWFDRSTRNPVSKEEIDNGNPDIIPVGIGAMLRHQ